MKAIPRSRATTAYGLLNEIIKTIEEEPLRLRMGVVCLRGEVLPLPMGARVPECGTVGCIAGWALTLRRQTTPTTRIFSDTSDAQKLLGLSLRQNEELFFPSELILATNQQTPEHVAATVAHIRGFQERYEKQLKAHKLPPLPRAQRAGA